MRTQYGPQNKGRYYVDKNGTVVYHFNNMVCGRHFAIREMSFAMFMGVEENENDDISHSAYYTWG